MTLVAAEGDKNSAAVREGMLKRGPELHYFTAVNAISKYYESNTAHWNDPHMWLFGKLSFVVSALPMSMLLVLKRD